MSVPPGLAAGWITVLEHAVAVPSANARATADSNRFDTVFIVDTLLVSLRTAPDRHTADPRR
jgi:hypothetical protein